MGSTVLSIIVPCYNRYEHLAKSLKVLKQDEAEEVEIIIIDDCSTDGSYAKLCAYKSVTDLNLRIVKNETNLGPGPSRNKGIALAEGKYITFLDADDFYSGGFLQEILPLLRQDYDCIVFDYNLVSLSGNPTRYSCFFVDMPPGLIEKKEAAVFIRGNTSCKVYRKDRIGDIRFLNQRRNEDMPFTKSVILNCDKIYYHKKAYYNYVMHSDSLMHDDSLYSDENAKRAVEYISSLYRAEFPKEVEAIYAHEYLYSAGLNTVNKLSRKTWKKHIEEIESAYPLAWKNQYVACFPKHVIFLIKTIHYRFYLLLKFFRKSKTIIKTIKESA